jgi:hypothetical protein
LPTFVTLQHRSTCTAGLLVALGLHGRGRVARRPIDGPWGRGGIRGLALACSTNNQVGIAGTAGLPPPAAHRLVLAYLHHPATLQHFRCRCHCRCRCHSAALGWLRPTGWCRPRRRPVPPAARPPANFAQDETWKRGSILQTNPRKAAAPAIAQKEGSATHEQYAPDIPDTSIEWSRGRAIGARQRTAYVVLSAGRPPKTHAGGALL